MKKSKKILLWLGGGVLALAILGHIYAKICAHRYGIKMSNCFMYLGKSGFADTDMMKARFNEDDLTVYENQVRRLGFLGEPYFTEIQELKEGLIYYSEQASLAPADRFAHPPVFKYILLHPAEPGDDGLGNATGNFIISFLQRN